MREPVTRLGCCNGQNFAKPSSVRCTEGHYFIWQLAPLFTQDDFGLTAGSTAFAAVPICHGSESLRFSYYSNYQISPRPADTRSFTKHAVRFEWTFCGKTDDIFRLYKCTYKLYTLFIYHSYTFRSPPATILRVYSIKEYNKSCVWRICPRSEFIKCYKILKFLLWSW